MYVFKVAGDRFHHQYAFMKRVCTKCDRADTEHARTIQEQTAKHCLVKYTVLQRTVLSALSVDSPRIKKKPLFKCHCI